MRGDDRGLEGLPLQLLIVMIVVGFTVPAVYAGLASSERGQLDLRVRAAVQRVVAAAQAFYLAGGGSDVVEVDLSGLLTVSVDYVVFGGPGGNASLVRYRLTGEPERFVLAEHPSVPMAARDGGPLALGSGRYRVLVEAAAGDFVRLSVV